jgi:hypothetical protein
LGPGVPVPPKVASVVPKSETRHRLPAGAVVRAKLVLGRLDHEYSRAGRHLIAMVPSNICKPRLFAHHNPSRINYRAI